MPVPPPVTTAIRPRNDSIAILRARGREGTRGAAAGIGGPPRRRVGGRAAGGALRAGATAAGASGAGPGRRRVPIARAPPRLARRNAMAGRRPSPLLAFALLALAAFRAGAEPPPAKPAKPAKDWEVELLAY